MAEEEEVDGEEAMAASSFPSVLEARRRCSEAAAAVAVPPRLWTDSAYPVG